jgi:hypothetical protein
MFVVDKSNEQNILAIGELTQQNYSHNRKTDPLRARINDADN